jgi:hypothetical protein
MAEPAGPPSSRRSARAARRGRWTRILNAAIALLMAALIVTVGLVVGGVVELPGAGSAANAGAPRTGSTTTRPRPTTRGVVRRELTHADPLRLWIAGDSLAGSLGPSLGEQVAKTGVVQPQYDSRVSSGLTNRSFFDWPKHAQEQLALLDPEVVVFVIGTNDANVWDPGRADAYRLQTLAMMRELVGSHHRDVFWIGAPVARDRNLETGVKAVNLVARSAARSVPGVTFVDTHALFADGLGRYQQSFPDELGVRRVMRAGDGIHFSVDGGDYLGRAVFALIDRLWNLQAQADPTQPLTVRETEGSTQVAGTHRSVGATVVGGGSSTTTTSRPHTSVSSVPTSSTSSSTTSTPSSSSTTSTTTTAPPATPSRSPLGPGPHLRH